MTNEEKILEVLDQHGKMFAAMQSQLSQLQSDMGDVKSHLTGVEGRLTKVEDDTHFTRVYIEQKIEKDIGLLAEGQTLLAEKVEDLLAGKELAEETKAKVDVVYDVVSQHSVDIKAIKNSSVVPFPGKKQQ